MDVVTQIRTNVIEGDAPATLELVKQALTNGIPAEQILNEGLIAAMAHVGKLFEEGEYYVPKMLIAARAMKGGLDLLRPALAAAKVQAIGKIVIGTVQGDLHDIGKNLVAMMMEGAGFEVIDLGVDVTPEKFVEAINAHLAGSGFTLLKGIEVDILDDGSLDQEPELLERLDVVVASMHSKLRSPADVMTARMLGAVRNPRTNVLGHCTGRLIQGERGTRGQSSFDAEVVFEACRAFDVAVEINSRPERQDPPDDLLALANDTGCLFSIDTDAHAPGQLEFLAYGADRASRAGIDPDRVITTWPVDRLLAWARRA